MTENQLTKLPFDSTFLPENWVVIEDRSESEPIFIALPSWLLERIKNGGWVSDQDFSQYVSETNDLLIDFNLNKTK